MTAFSFKKNDDNTQDQKTTEEIKSQDKIVFDLSGDNKTTDTITDSNPEEIANISFGAPIPQDDANDNKQNVDKTIPTEQDTKGDDNELKIADDEPIIAQQTKAEPVTPEITTKKSNKTKTNGKNTDQQLSDNDFTAIQTKMIKTKNDHQQAMSDIEKQQNELKLQIQELVEKSAQLQTNYDEQIQDFKKSLQILVEMAETIAIKL